MIKKLLMVITLCVYSHYASASNYDKAYQDHIMIARAYYTAMAEKNMQGVADYLDEQVVFLAPRIQIEGKQNFLTRVQEFFDCFITLTIEHVQKNQNNVEVLFTVDYPDSIGCIEMKAYMHIQNGLIINIQLLYDPAFFDTK